MNVGDPDQLIDKIREQYLSKSPELVRSSLHGHSNVVQMNFVSSYFPLEFLQNADDEEATSVRFHVRQINGEWCLEILNDGHPFTDSALSYADDEEVKDDVTGLCAAGVSPKHPRDHIGFIGVGFKSIFEISQHVEVHSNGFHFQFDRSKAERYGDDVPWRVVPWSCEPSDETDIHEARDGTEYTTRFVVKLDERGRELLAEKNLFEPLGPENIDRRVFLFLKSVRQLHIVDEYSGQSRHIEASTGIDSADSLFSFVEEAKQEFLQREQQRIREEAKASFDPIEVIELTEKQQPKGKTETDRWVLFKHLWKVPCGIKNDPKTEQYMRGGVEYREVFIAAVVNDEGEFARPENGTLHTGVFSYLPLKELDIDFDFLVHADFLTPADRQTIKEEVPWNRKIADGVVGCLEDTIRTIAHHDHWWTGLATFVPESQGDTFVTNEIVDPVHDFLEEESLLRDQAGEMVGLDECQIVDDHIYQAFDASQIEKAGAERPVHENHKEIYETVRRSNTLGLTDLIQNFDVGSVTEELVGANRKETFEKIYEGLSTSRSLTQKRTLENSGIPLEDGQTVGTDDVEQVYFPPSGLDMDEFEGADPLSETKSSLAIVDRNLAENETIREVLEVDRVAVEELTEGHLISAWLESKDWQQLNDADRRTATAFLCRSYRDGDWSADDFPTLRVEAQDESWLDPSHLLLGDAYNPEASLDDDIPPHELPAADWFVSETVRRHSRIFAEAGVDELRHGPRYVSEAYLETTTDLSSEDWRAFFRELGVDSMLERSHVRGALGELYVHLHLEEQDDTSVSHATIGRDLDLEDVSEDSNSRGRIVEVKSTKESSKEFDLQAAQTKLLLKQQEQYFVYRVTDILSKEPKICIADGEKLIEKGSFRLELSRNKWRSASTRIK